MTVSVLIPFAGVDEYRVAARDWIIDRYHREHRDWEIIEASSDGVWRKGVAVDSAAARASHDVFVIADADLFIDPGVLDHAARLVQDSVPWVVPHGKVFRLNRSATAHTMNGIQRRAPVVRSPYLGPAGGGIVVLTRAAYDTVHGIDNRFEGWGGEDISFGWALDTLVGPHVRLGADLFHLWHPHSAPRGRGSKPSEALAGQYRDANLIHRRMAAIVEHRDPGPAPILNEPVTFTVPQEHRVILAAGQRIRFDDHQHTTDNSDVADALRRMTDVEEVTDARRLVRR